MLFQMSVSLKNFSIGNFVKFTGMPFASKGFPAYCWFSILYCYIEKTAALQVMLCKIPVNYKNVHVEDLQNYLSLCRAAILPVQQIERIGE